jgi:hypothetical protein
MFIMATAADVGEGSSASEMSSFSASLPSSPSSSSRSLPYLQAKKYINFR